MSKLSRRDFLKASAAVVGSACCTRASGILTPSIVQAQSQAGNGNVAIFIALDGGMDPLNSFDIPYGASNYYARRPTFAIPSGSVLPTVNGVRGLHPSLSNIRNMFNSNEVAIIIRAGTKTPTFSHDTEQDKYARGNSTYQGTGWVGRLFDKIVLEQGGSVTPYNTITIGMGAPNETISSRSTFRPINMSSVGNYSITGHTGSSTNESNWRNRIHSEALDLTSPSAPIPVAVDQALEGAYGSFADVQAALAHYNSTGGPNTATFGTNSPGPQLRDASILAQANFDGVISSGTQIMMCNQGGHDLHSDLGGVTGNMATLMQRIDQGVNAFRNRAIARGYWNNVYIVLYSEFGRNLRQNNSAGLDHGQAGVVVVIGGAVNGGVYGDPISNAEFNGANNWISVSYRFETIFRQVVGNGLALPTTGIWESTPDYFTIA